MHDSDLLERMLRLTDGRSRQFKNRQAYSSNSARIWIRAGFKCEYCDQPFTDSFIAYRSYEYDHLLPRSRYSGNPLIDIKSRDLWSSKIFTEEELRNYALSCAHCNSLKSDFDPNAEASVYPGEGPISQEARELLIQEVRNKIGPLQDEWREMFELVKGLVENIGR